MKFQEIKNTGTGNSYVTHYGKRLPLSMFERCNGDFIYHKGESLQVHGWYSVGYFGAYGVHISACGDKAIVIYKQN